MEPRIVTLGIAQQEIVRAVFNNITPLNGNDTVAIAYARQAVRNYEYRTVAADVLHVFVDDALRFIIECAGRFIKD